MSSNRRNPQTQSIKMTDKVIAIRHDLWRLKVACPNRAEGLHLTATLQ